MRKTLIILGIIVLSPLWLYVGYLVLFGGTWWLLGYEQGLPSWKLAEKLVRNHRPAKDCFLLRTTDIGPRPTTFELQTSCVYEYAKILKDPSACALLMPDIYGLRCIGNIWGPLIDESNCLWYKDNAVRCFEGPKLIPHIFDCGDPEQRAVSDECKHRFAFKQKNDELCDAIGNATLRSVCQTRIRIWMKYPELRSTIYFKNNIE
jgi:hypothetical protein